MPANPWSPAVQRSKKKREEKECHEPSLSDANPEPKRRRSSGQRIIRKPACAAAGRQDEQQVGVVDGEVGVVEDIVAVQLQGERVDFAQALSEALSEKVPCRF